MNKFQVVWGNFWDTKTGRHIYSFIKTYVTVFLSIYLAVYDLQSEGASISLLDMAVILPAAKWAFISVLRNIYKAVTESN